MKSKLSDISTVIIVNKGGQSTRTVQVKSKHISRIKHYATGIMAVILLLSGIIVYLKAQNQRQEEEKTTTAYPTIKT